MLNTKEHFKEIEMDTIQQEPLFTKLTPEAAATVQGGILFTTIGVTTTLNIRNAPSLRTGKVIGSIKAGAIFDATNIVSKNGFRRLTVQTARALTGQAIGWVSRAFIRRV
ncbi:hypothetical protein [uncultured Nostoc sp.]|uniref:hypothetical protein n=1 Tax=uncultured Nostoc sp. TaxID=340711 RepID=UPI002632D4BC|nr:hypothetical protein [uncultured Nostoc sp.]